MRPLHTLVLLVVLLVAGAGAWLLLSGGPAAREAVSAGTPLPAAAPAGAADSQLRLPGSSAKTPTPIQPERVALEAAPQQPASDTSASEAEPRVAGRVVDAFGNPLAGATVYVAAGGGFGLPLDHTGLADARWLKRGETQTAADGSFELAGPRPGLLRVAVRAPGFAPLDKNDLPLPAAPRHDLGDLVMEQGVRLEGRVVDSRGGGVAGVSLWKEDPSAGGFFLHLGSERSGVLLAETGAAGEFRIDQLEAGPWKLRATHLDHPDRIAEGLTERAGQAVSGLRIELEDGFTISGRLSGAPGGLEDLSVRASPARGSADGEGLAIVFEGDFGGGETREAEIGADGSFMVRGLRGGKKYSVQARKKRADYFHSTQSAPVVAQPGDRGVELVWQPEAALVFQVVDRETGDPVTELSVSAGIQWPMPLMDDEGRPLREHEGGNVRFGNLRPKSEKDRAQLEISAVGYRDHSQKDIVLRSGQETDLGIIELEPVTVVRVTVRDRKTGLPIEGARVSLREDAGSRQAGHAMFVQRSIEVAGEDGDFVVHGDETNRGKTDAEGVAIVNAFEQKSQLLTVTQGDYAPYKGAAFIVQPGEDAVQEVLLGPGGSVAVELVTSKGQPVAGGRVEHRAPSGGGGPEFDFIGQSEGPRNVTDEAGRVVFDHLEPGTHRFRAAGGGGPGAAFMGDVGFVSMAGAPGGEDDASWVDVLVVEDATAEVTVVAPTKVRLTGRVREGGEPLAGATLSLQQRRAGESRTRMPMFDGGPEAKTDGQGRYQFDNVESGDYTLRVEHPQRFMPAELEVTLLEADLVRDVDLTVAIIEGRITDQNGQPLAGMRVWPERAQKQGTEQRRAIRIMMESDGAGSSVMLGDSGMQGLEKRTDADGNYSLRGVLEGVELQVVAEGPGVQEGRSDPVTLAPSQIRRGLDLVLKAAGEIQVIVQRPDGSPAGNLLVTATFEGEVEGQRPGTETGFVAGDGRARLTGLAAGSWKVSLRRLGFGPDNTGEGDIPPQTIEVTVGATAEGRFTLP